MIFGLQSACNGHFKLGGRRFKPGAGRDVRGLERAAACVALFLPICVLELAM
jgi:hypothetical protein